MKYTPEQVNAYLSRISFPVNQYKPITLNTAGSIDGLHYLYGLQKYHLASIPFENLSLHYSQERVVSINKDDIFKKMVTSGSGRGGYCMEHNLLFGTILRSIGFEVISTGARVMGPCGEFNGWDHQVLLVCMNSGVFLVDVGFGSSSPTKPIKLSHGQVMKWGATDAETKLVYQEPSNPIVQGLWTLEHRNSTSEQWSPKYCFAMTEFLSNDFEVMNYATSTRRTVMFTYRLMCMKMILDENVGDITGALTLSGSTLKKRVHAKSEVLIECVTEQQRVTTLKEHFGINLSPMELAGIKGTVTELTG